MKEGTIASITADSVNEIVEDLSDRRGLRQPWEQIDEEIQEQIKGVWRAIIAKHLREAVRNVGRAP